MDWMQFDASSVGKSFADVMRFGLHAHNSLISNGRKSNFANKTNVPGHEIDSKHKTFNKN